MAELRVPEPQMGPRQKRVLTGLSVAAIVVFYLSAVVGIWLMVLVFPIGYATVVVRNWHKP